MHTDNHAHRHDAGHGHEHGPSRGHGHAHHHGAGHDHTHGASERSVGIAALLTGAFMLAEVAGGLVSGSLALLADAGHMLTDFASLALAWYGFRLARRPADWQRTFGYDRFSVLIAFANGLTLFAIAVWICVEAYHRLTAPGEVLGGIMFWVALMGLAVNIAAFWVLQGGDRTNLNVRAAILHVAGDLLGSLAAIAAAVVIMATGWSPIDPILSVVVALIILRSAWAVVKDSAHILLEGVPAGLDPRTIASDIQSTLPDVVDIHHVHIWSITQERPMVTLHARVNGAAETPPERTVAAIKARLREKFAVEHATIEIEHEACADEATDRRA